VDRSPWKSTLAAFVLTLSVAGCSLAGFPRLAFGPPPSGGVETAAPVTSAPETPAPGTPAPTPVPATPVPLQPPPAPSDVTFHVRHTPAGHSPGTDTYTITWNESPSAGVEIRVSGLTKCLSNVMDQPCIARHMTIPSGALKVIQRAPASKGSVSWTWPTSEVTGDWVGSDGPNLYYAFLVGAYNAAGQSRLVIATSANACPGCVY
jgi:hypothetical protein